MSTVVGYFSSIQRVRLEMRQKLPADLQISFLSWIYHSSPLFCAGWEPDEKKLRSPPIHPRRNSVEELPQVWLLGVKVSGTPLSSSPQRAG